MVQIDYQKLSETQNRMKFETKNADKINSLFGAYCDSQDHSVDNLATYASAVKRQIANSLWKEHLEKSKRSKEAREKKKQQQAQENKQDNSQSKQQNQSKQKFNNNQQNKQKNH